MKMILIKRLWNWRTLKDRLIKKRRSLDAILLLFILEGSEIMDGKIADRS